MKKSIIAFIALPFAMSAFAQDDAAAQCKVVIEANDAMQYNIDNFTINKEQCPEFTIELKHVGALAKSAMGHNVVLTKSADFKDTASDGAFAGLDNNYIKPDDERVIAHTDVVGGGEQTEVTFDTAALEAGGDYTFFCSFPSHSMMMSGTVDVE